MSATTLPLSFTTNPSPARWFRFDPDRTVHVAVGKVEIGQGIVTALAQIAAEELDVKLDAIRILSGDTDAAPDEGSTTSSLSIEVGGTSLRLIAAEVRARMLDRLAQRLNCAPGDITVTDGAFFRGTEATGQDYWSLAPEVDLAREADGGAIPKPVASYRIVGQSVPRRDLPAKLGAGAFIHDMVRPDLLHARILRQPARGARLAALDEAAIRRAAGGEIRIVRRGNFVALLSADETVAQRAGAAAPAHARWENLRVLTPAQQEAAWLVGQPSDDRVIGDPLPAAAGTVIEARYSRPYVAHASIAPSCALAESRDGHLSVWSHTQGVYPLRNGLAKVLGRPVETISVHHAQGAGCYGHNGADDVALDAARLARAVPGRPVRVLWSRADELSWAPFGPAMAVELEADLDAADEVIGWRHTVWSNGHGTRPGRAASPALLGAWHMAQPFERPAAVNAPLAAGGGAERNAVPPYDFPAWHVVNHRVLAMPLRTSALRALGAFANVFACESFIDELAHAIGADPIEYRLRHLTDPRARAVIERVRERSAWRGWQPREGRGHGIGYARYKGSGAHCAVVAEVEAEREIRLRRLIIAVDVGIAINPDGVANQIEGGAIQAASWTLKEAVRFDRERVTSDAWENYPILRFSEIPAVEVELVRSGQPPLGAGEASLGPTAAAIANAVHDALGVRVRELPITAERILSALE